MDRVEYLMSRVHDHLDDGDEIAHRQTQEVGLHVRRTMEYLTIARGLVELLEKELRRFGRTPEPGAPQIMRKPPVAAGRPHD